MSIAQTMEWYNPPLTDSLRVCASVHAEPSASCKMAAVTEPRSSCGNRVFPRGNPFRYSRSEQPLPEPVETIEVKLSAVEKRASIAGALSQIEPKAARTIAKMSKREEEGRPKSRKT